MPELPEVETTRLGILPHLLHKQVQSVIVRQKQLRWPIPSQLNKILVGEVLNNIERRGKYLLLFFSKGCLIIHLGMSGKLRVLRHEVLAAKHDHCDIFFSSGNLLRFNDPRRFGAILWTDHNPMQHALLAHLGVEPLAKDFTADYLFKMNQNKKISIKQHIMDSKVVVGVGNIYANEALFLARIAPDRSAFSLTQTESKRLVKAIKIVLHKAIQAGGTTLKDFLSAEGKPGYFSQQLQVYGREGMPCYFCENPIQQIRQAQRATYFCLQCQPRAII